MRMRFMPGMSPEECPYRGKGGREFVDGTHIAKCLPCEYGGSNYQDCETFGEINYFLQVKKIAKDVVSGMRLIT